MGLVVPRHVGSSRTRARTRVPSIGRQILNRRTTREALNNNINTLVVSSKSTALNQRAVTTRYKAVCRWGEASNAAPRREAGCDVKKIAPMVMNRSVQPGTLNPGFLVTVNIVA